MTKDTTGKEIPATAYINFSTELPACPIKENVVTLTKEVASETKREEKDLPSIPNSAYSSSQIC